MIYNISLGRYKGRFNDFDASFVSTSQLAEPCDIDRVRLRMITSIKTFRVIFNIVTNAFPFMKSVNL